MTSAKAGTAPDDLECSLLHINGAFVPSVGSPPKYIDAINPATGEAFARVTAGSADDIDVAVTAARAAFDAGTWSRIPASERAAILKRIAELMEKELDEFIPLETRDCGKPIPETKMAVDNVDTSNLPLMELGPQLVLAVEVSEPKPTWRVGLVNILLLSRWDMDDVVGCLKYFADVAEGEQPISVELPDPDHSGTIRYEPLGVAALITPWNYPLLMAMWKVAPALAAGCTCVLKPSEEASLTCLKFSELCIRGGLPPGALNVVTGYGPEAGAALAAHPGVDKVAFTGSGPTGRSVATAAAANLVSCTLEMGGKSSAIVMADADVNAAVEWVLFGAMGNGGQVCSATSRLLVHEDIATPFLERLKARAEALVVGDPAEDGVQLGPLIAARQYDKVMAFIQRAVEAGAKLLTGGGRPVGGPDAGYFVAPTVFVDVPRDMEIWREEVFGPVMCVRQISTLDEAIEVANDTEYGLAGAIFTQDPAA